MYMCLKIYIDYSNKIQVKLKAYNFMCSLQ